MEISKYKRKGGYKISKRTNISIEERFWDKVNKKGEDECWNWNACIDNYGYGLQNCNGATERTHRLSWKIHNGEIPEGVDVLHRCDNRKCCNPKHLFLGTSLDNIKDMVAKNRQSKGESRPTAKLTTEVVNKIREKYNKRIKTTSLAKEFNVSDSQIRFIVNNVYWKDNNYKPLHINGNAGENSYRTNLTWDKVNQIRERYKKGERQAKLAKEFGVKSNTISNIVNNKSWKKVEKS